MRTALRSVLLLFLFLALAGSKLACNDAEMSQREASLRTNLATLRDVIGQYRGDQGRYPETLQDLVGAGYLRKVPLDPITRSDATWVLVRAPGPGTLTRDVIDVRSGAPGRGLDGQPYREW